jgi:hypothetical protein
MHHAMEEHGGVKVQFNVFSLTLALDVGVFSAL